MENQDVDLGPREQLLLEMDLSGMGWDGGGRFGMSYLAFVAVFSLRLYLLCRWFFLFFFFLFSFFLVVGDLVFCFGFGLLLAFFL